VLPEPFEKQLRCEWSVVAEEDNCTVVRLTLASPKDATEKVRHAGKKHAASTSKSSVSSALPNASQQDTDLLGLATPAAGATQNKSGKDRGGASAKPESRLGAELDALLAPANPANPAGMGSDG